MTKDELQTKAENIALANFLANIPDSLSYDEIIESLSYDDEEDIIEKEIDVWSPFENISSRDVARYIEDLKDSIIWNFKEQK